MRGGGGEFESEKRDAFDQRGLGGLRLNGGGRRRDEEFGGGGDDQGSVGSYEEEDQKVSFWVSFRFSSGTPLWVLPPWRFPFLPREGARERENSR